MNNWQTVWSKREAGTVSPSLDELIRLDGYDSGAGAIAVADWRENSMLIAERLGLENGMSVYEVGCGSGAFLKALQEHHEISVGGIDYGENLVKTACNVFPEGNFHHGEAQKLETDDKYDFVISNGVFHYLTLIDAEKVLGLMIEKSLLGVAILEVPDQSFESESENIRQDALSPDEYTRKYKGLEHTYYNKNWFEQLATGLGYTCDISQVCVPNYAQSRFRFNTFLFPEK